MIILDQIVIILGSLTKQIKIKPYPILKSLKLFAGKTMHLTVLLKELLALASKNHFRCLLLSLGLSVSANTVRSSTIIVKISIQVLLGVYLQLLLHQLFYLCA